MNFKRKALQLKKMNMLKKAMEPGAQTCSHPKSLRPARSLTLVRIQKPTLATRTVLRSRPEHDQKA